MPCDRPAESRSKPLIAVVPMGSVPSIAAAVVAGHISGYLDLAAEVTDAVKLPGEALDPARLQYNAGRILKAIAALPWNSHQRVIAVLNVDLFVPIFTHVFGEAQQGGRCAVVSTFRLGAGQKAGSFLQPKVLERTAKIALHEIGHLFCLHHCQDPGCLMHFSGELEGLDATPIHFCRYCSAGLHQRRHLFKPEPVR